MIEYDPWVYVVSMILVLVAIIIIARAMREK